MGELEVGGNLTCRCFLRTAAVTRSTGIRSSLLGRWPLLARASGTRKARSRQDGSVVGAHFRPGRYPSSVGTQQTSRLGSLGEPMTGPQRGGAKSMDTPADDWSRNAPAARQHSPLGAAAPIEALCARGSACLHSTASCRPARPATHVTTASTSARTSLDGSERPSVAPACEACRGPKSNKSLEGDRLDASTPESSMLCVNFALL